MAQPLENYKMKEAITKTISNYQNQFKSQISFFNQLPFSFNHKNSFFLFGKQPFPQSSKILFENENENENDKDININYATMCNKLLIKRSNPVEMDKPIEKKKKSENSITFINNNTSMMSPFMLSEQSNSMQEYGSFSEMNNQKDDLYSFFVSDGDDNLEEEINENLSSIDKKEQNFGFNDFLSDENEDYEPSLISDILELTILNQPYETNFEDFKSQRE